MVKRFSASRLTRVLYDRSIDVFNQFFAFIFFLSTRSKGWKNKNKETPVTASSLLNILCTVVVLLHNNELNGKFLVSMATLVAVNEPI